MVIAVSNILFWLKYTKSFKGGAKTEYALRNTDIFDEQIGTLFNQEILANLGCFGTGRVGVQVLSSPSN
jgi:hypothetical protein